MSFVDANLLKSVRDASLIERSVKINLSAKKVYDTITIFESYYTQVLVDNKSSSDITYRTDPNGTIVTQTPRSQKIIAGWGSYFEIITTAGDIALDFSLVHYQNARRLAQ